LILFIPVNYDKIKERVGQGMRHEWGKRNAYRVLLGKPEAKRPLGRPWCM
jgi:hypothetical protein